jgi:hypothetical protein
MERTRVFRGFAGFHHLIEVEDFVERDWEWKLVGSFQGQLICGVPIWRSRNELFLEAIATSSLQALKQQGGGVSGMTAVAAPRLEGLACKAITNYAWSLVKWARLEVLTVSTGGADAVLAWSRYRHWQPTQLRHSSCE